MTITLTGSASSDNASTNALAVGPFNVNAGDTIVVDVQTNGQPVSSITGGPTMTRRVSIATANAARVEERWTGTAASTGSLTLSVNETTSAFMAAVASSWSGCAATPFDTGGPQTIGGGSIADPVSITTHNANTVLLAAFRMSTTGSPTAESSPLAFTQIAALASSFHLVEYLSVSSAGTYSCGIGTGSGDSGASIVDALVDVNQPSSPIIGVGAQWL